jgi:hypothetical protein
MGPVDRETCHEHPFQDQWPFHISARCRYFFCCGSLLFGFALALFDPVSGVAFLFIPPLSWLSIFFAPGLLSAGSGPFAVPQSFLSLSLVPFCPQCWHGASRCCSALIFLHFFFSLRSCVLAALVLDG